MSDKNVNVGLGKVYFSVFNEEEGTYGAITEINDLISFSIQPSESSSSLYAGDRKIIVDYTTSVSGSIGVPSVPDDVFMTLFGYEKFGETVNYNEKAKRPNIALIIEEHNYQNNKVHILWDCKLTLPQSQGNTKGDSISYGTKELSWEALIPEDGIYLSTLPEGDPRLDLAGNLDKLAIAGVGGSANVGEAYIGRIALSETGSGSVIQYNAITAQMVKTAAHVEKVPCKVTKDYIADCADNDYMIIAIPKDSVRVGKKDNGFGGHVEFSTETAGANGNVELEIDGVMYKLYGEICLAQGRFKLQID